MRRVDALSALFLIAALVQGRAAVADLAVPYVSVPPVVDGIMEDVWHEADSIDAFIQQQPYEGQPISAPTRAYVLQNDAGLFFAFRCETPGRTPDCPPGPRGSQEGDYVSVFLDTFHDRTNCYHLSVNCAGIQADEIISADGRASNFSWDGIFTTAVVFDSIGYTVEMEIPWGTLRYANGKDVWGVNLARAIPRGGEIAYAAPVRLNEGFRVSRFMQLSGLKLQVRTHGIEFYPQGFFRTEKSYGERSETWHPATDLNWALTPWWRLQSTFNPDFSQVEADPFALNLSKYGLFFDEKRLFFVEGDEYFQPSGGVMADMLQIFYSRQVGMKLPDGAEVPIHAGGRTTVKIKNHEVAALFAQTGAKSYEGFAGPDREPAAAFAVARMNLRVATPTTAAVTFAGKFSDSTTNSVLALDGTTNEDTWQFTYQLARSEMESEADWAFKSYVSYLPGKFSVSARTTVIGDRFDVSDIGFVPWFGLRSYSVSAGPVVYPDSGLFVYGALRLTAGVSRELGEARYSNSYTLQLEGALRNNWGFGASAQRGREYEIAGAYNPRAWSVFIQTDVSRRTWLSLSYYSVFQYNYLRDYFGRSDFANLYSSWRPSKRFSVFLGGSAWVERRPNGGIEEITWRLRPGISYALARGMDVRLYEETPIRKTTGVVSFRLGFSYSYNFAPKSWLYLAINDWQRRDSDNGRYVPQQRVLAVKIKYLISL